jgi:hypothetical protein
MSYRIGFNGYNRLQMRSLLGSHEANAIARIYQRIDAERAYPDDVRSECKAIVARAINDGVPFKDLEAETYVHSWAAELLALDNQEWHPTYCDYHWEVVQAFRQRARKHARPDVRAFITGLCEGVPMFGQRFTEVESPYYASFALPKVISFHEGLQELQDSLPPANATDPESVGFARFLNDLIGYLGQIKDKQMDCWYSTG